MRTVLFIAPSAYPLGGIADWLEYLLPGLSAYGWRCALGLTVGRFHLADEYLARHSWDHTVQLRNATGSPEGRVVAIMNAIQEIEPDIVAVANIFDAYEAVRRLRVEGKTKTRVVMTLHGLQGDLLMDIGSEQDVLDAVVVTNRLTQILANESIGDALRVLYAPYGVPIAERRTEPKTLRRDQLKLLYCGRLEQSQKRILDLPALLLALAQIGVDATLSIAGAGPDEDALRNEVLARGLQRKIHFLGFLDHGELSTCYKFHDALILTSSWETGPIVAWEAMSHRLPVLSSRYLGSGRENALIDGVNCLLFPIGDMPAAAARAQNLLDCELRSRITQGGFNLVKARYSQQASVREWATDFETILNLPRLYTPTARRRHQSESRLDRLFGASLGERIRRSLDIEYVHADIGGEWPHTSHSDVNQARWLAEAGDMDVLR